MFSRKVGHSAQKRPPRPFNLQGLVWPREPTSLYFTQSRNDCRNRSAVLEVGWSCQVQTWEGEVQIHFLTLKKSYILLLSSNEHVFNEVRKGGRKGCCGIKREPPCHGDCHNAIACLPRTEHDSLASFFHYFIHSIYFLFKFLPPASLCARKTVSILKHHGI